VNKFILCLILLIASSLASASGESMHIVHPKGTQLKLVELKTNPDTLAKFTGQVWITGTFIGRWPAGETNNAYKTPDYFLVPDTTSIAKLPYFVLKESPYLNSYRVKIIDLQNGEVALHMVVSEEDASRLLQRKVNKVKAIGKFLIEAYVVGVECDAPWAHANLVRFEKPDKLAAFLKVPEGC
jgi:hypothetical protein